MKSSSSTDAVVSPDAPILVGIVLRPHGIRGEVTVAVQSDNQARFAAGAALRATPPAGRDSRTLRIVRSAPHKGGLRIAFEGFDGREAAESLRGCELTVPRSAVPPAKAGSYYLFELVGCRCVDEREGELGIVSEVVADGGGWLLEVEQPDGEPGETSAHGRRLALPFVEEFLVRIDREARRIEWRLPEGLVEACASRY
jgi:16S rRNA processing protein RimM